MSKKYHIYAYKHYWPAGGIDEYDIPVPYTKDKRGDSGMFPDLVDGGQL